MSDSSQRRHNATTGATGREALGAGVSLQAQLARRVATDTEIRIRWRLPPDGGNGSGIQQCKQLLRRRIEQVSLDHVELSCQCTLD